MIAPLVVGMEEDEIGLNSDAAQLEDQAVEMLEVSGIEGRVIIRLAVAWKRIHGRLFAIVLVPLGKEAHAQLVEGRGGERLDGLALRGFGLKGPRVAGGAAFDIGRAIRIAEMVAVANRNRTTISTPGGDTLKCTGLAVKGRLIAGSRPGPVAKVVRHEADLVHAFAVIETFDRKRTVLQSERGGKGDIDERIAGGRSVEGKFKSVPARDWYLKRRERLRPRQARGPRLLPPRKKRASKDRDDSWNSLSGAAAQIRVTSELNLEGGAMSHYRRSLYMWRTRIRSTVLHADFLKRTIMACLTASGVLRPQILCQGSYPGRGGLAISSIIMLPWLVSLGITESNTGGAGRAGHGQKEFPHFGSKFAALGLSLRKTESPIQQAANVATYHYSIEVPVLGCGG